MQSRNKLGLGAALTVGAAVAAVALAGPASAHVTVSAPGATQGGYATITFKVPTESDAASTVGLKVQLPTDAPLATVSVQPKAGWTYTVVKGTPSTPLSSDDGAVKEVVMQIDWKVAAGNPGIKPGEFDQFVISAGPLPKASSLAFKAIQTYSDGQRVSWIETSAPGSTTKPAHPAPTLSLAAGASAAPSPATSASEVAAVAGAGPRYSRDGGPGSSSLMAKVALGVAIFAALAAAAAVAGVFTVRGKFGKG